MATSLIAQSWGGGSIILDQALNNGNRLQFSKGISAKRLREVLRAWVWRDCHICPAKLPAIVVAKGLLQIAWEVRTAYLLSLLCCRPLLRMTKTYFLKIISGLANAISLSRAGKLYIVQLWITLKYKPAMSIDEFAILSKRNILSIHCIVGSTLVAFPEALGAVYSRSHT